MSVYRELLHISQSINVIHIGAHPDDEDTGLISYLSNKYGMRVFYWSATRGEKGHNHANTLHDAALGILRTWESLDAAAINHSECIFGPFIDFGFTKNAKTALMYWNHLESLDDIDWTNERITKEIVRTIRQYKPLIIISRWSGAPADFHGHHQAVGLATRAAFDLAGQPHVFQELEDEDLYPWQPLKLYISTDNSAGMQTFGGALNLSGKQNHQLENQPNIITINTGELEPDSQNTYQERGWLAYGQHRSQGMAQPSAPGDFKYYFELAKSLCGQGVDFLGGIDPSLRGLARLLNLTDPSSLSALNHAQQLCDETLNLHLTGERQQCAQRLLSLLSTLRTFNQDLKGSNLTPTNIHALKCYIEHKIRQTEELICTLFHLRFEALIDGMYFVQGTQNGISLQLFAYGNAVVDHVEFGLDVPAIATLTKKSDFDFSLSPNDPDAITSARLFRQDYRLYTGFGEMDTEVYWLRQPNDGRLYDWEDSPYAGRAFGKHALLATCKLHLQGVSLALRSPCTFHEARGVRSRTIVPLSLPAVQLTVNQAQLFCPLTVHEQRLRIQVGVKQNVKTQDILTCTLHIEHDDIFQVLPFERTVELEYHNAKRNLEFTIVVPALVEPGKYSFQLKCHYGPVIYDTFYLLAMQGLEGVDLHTTTDEFNCRKHALIQEPALFYINILSVNYVKGLTYAVITGEHNLDSIFRSANLAAAKLSYEDITPEKLHAFDAIIVGANAYSIHFTLRKNNAHLLSYIRQGGTLIVFHQKYTYSTLRLAPYPFTYAMPHDRVTVAESPVRILAPDHWLFNAPNQIDEADFQGWQVDRGLYFWHEWDRAYTPLLACADPGEPEKLGGMLYCNYGRGFYIYVGYSLVRQIFAGVAGAMRIFANLLAIPQKIVEARADFLKQAPIFKDLTDDELQKIAHIIREPFYGKGEYICHQHTVGNELYIIRSGNVAVIKEAGGIQSEIAELSEGACVGEFSILADIPRTASLVAKTPVHLMAISSHDFQKLMLESPAITKNIIRILIERLNVMH